MKSISFNQAKAKGFSLIELLLVLGVLAILLVAAFVVYPQVRDRNQANAEVSNLTAIKANVTNLYASKGGNYAGLTNTVAVQARVFPSNMTTSTGSTSSTANSAWGGTVAVVAAGTGTSANREFTVTYSTVPSGVCLGLVSGAAGNFKQIRVGSTDVMTGTPASFQPATAATACNASDPTVVFTSN